MASVEEEEQDTDTLSIQVDNASGFVAPSADLRRLQLESNRSDSWYEQVQVEDRVHAIRVSLPELGGPILVRERHIRWLKRNLRGISKGYQSYDALQPWVLFWIVHSFNVLDVPLTAADADAVVHRLSAMQAVGGGYGGGPGQSAHIASTFAAVMALLSVGTADAHASIDVPSITKFLISMKQADGSFRVSYGGEADARGIYCALAVASILNIIKPGDKTHLLLKHVASYIASLQAFDGGLAGEPGAEAHGGNTYCAFAAALISECTECVDTSAVLDWAVMRQMSFEGGFQGRTNKLVDSCYSFWVGSLFPLMSLAQPRTADQSQRPDIASCFNANALQLYILECCQLSNGGFRDKPGTPRDLMHTCYALSGLSVTQHYGGASVQDERNKVCRINVIYNLREDKYEAARRYFEGLTL